jgi:hypothetical protein
MLSDLARDYFHPFLLKVIRDDRLARLFSTSLYIGLGHWVPVRAAAFFLGWSHPPS